MPRAYAAILVQSTSHALRAEKLLHRAGIESKLIPVPRALSSDCGVCLRIAVDDADRARAALESHRAPFEDIVTYYG